MELDVATYQRVLGDELRLLRKRRGWTRKDLNDRLRRDISLQTLATYELGTRQISVIRLVEICHALDELPHDLLARVHQRVFTEAPIGRIRVDLRKVARDAAPELSPLRRWASGRLAERPAAATVVLLDIAALEYMAKLCGMDTVELIAQLRRIA
ncbi:helix-turn-helix transcriptional regulator [Actinophytocola sp.]|uniref:helix-turn-helix transcriptional regulator n=1 Tax=Actinophytocola sp. TaxID=1872138 RepID=UPI002D800778|nr:helix-turn-helix transcriptional regulator [Actinophytocola sp.]HET9143247.1 helix-turn-helix transcriptional regulator [Actinophytocola sp.]